MAYWFDFSLRSVYVQCVSKTHHANVTINSSNFNLFLKFIHHWKAC